MAAITPDNDAMPSPLVGVAVATPVPAAVAVAQPVAMPVSFGNVPVPHGSTNERVRVQDIDCFDSNIDIRQWPARDGEWSSGLTDCAADGQSCLIGLCYPACQFAFTSTVAFGRDGNPEQCGMTGNEATTVCFLAKYGGARHFVWTVLLIWLYVAVRTEASRGMLFAQTYTQVVFAFLGVLLLLAYAQSSSYAAKWRGELRAKHGIRGSSMTDCFLQFFCEPCAIMQEAREVKIRLQSAAVVGVPSP